MCMSLSVTLNSFAVYRIWEKWLALALFVCMDQFFEKTRGNLCDHYNGSCPLFHKFKFRGKLLVSLL